MATPVLKGKVTLDTSNFQRGLRKLPAIGKAFAATMARVAGTELKRLSSAGLRAGKALAASLVKGVKLGLKTLGFVATGAAAALVAGVSKAYGLGRSLRALSEQTGILPGRLLVMRQAFEDADAGADQLGATINKMQRAMQEASDGMAAPRETFDRLGLSLGALQALTPDEQFLTIGRAINQLADPAERSAAAMELFGRAGGKFLALFSAGGAMASATLSLGRQTKILDQSSEVFEDVTVRFQHVGQKLQGFFVGVADKLAPVLLPILTKLDKMDLTGAGQKFGDALIKGVQVVMGIFKNPRAAIELFVNAFSYGMLQAGNILIATLKAARNYFQNGMVETIQGIGNVLLGVLMKAFQVPIAYLNASIDALFARLRKMLGGTGEIEAAKTRRDYLEARMNDAAAHGKNARKKGSDEGFGAADWKARYDQLKAEKAKLEPIINNSVSGRAQNYLSVPLQIQENG